MSWIRIARRILGVLTLGGSFLGLVLIAQHVLESPLGLNAILMVLFGALYGWGVVIGVRLLERSPAVETEANIYWALQLPVFYSGVLSYEFCSGAKITISVSSSGVFNFFGKFGSEFQFWLMTPTEFVVGINVFAIAALVVLGKIWRETGYDPVMPDGGDTQA